MAIDPLSLEIKGGDKFVKTLQLAEKSLFKLGVASKSYFKNMVSNARTIQSSTNALNAQRRSVDALSNSYRNATINAGRFNTASSTSRMAGAGAGAGVGRGGGGGLLTGAAILGGARGINRNIGQRLGGLGGNVSTLTNLIKSEMQPTSAGIPIKGFQRISGVPSTQDLAEKFTATAYRRGLPADINNRLQMRARFGEVLKGGRRDIMAGFNASQLASQRALPTVAKTSLGGSSLTKSRFGFGSLLSGGGLAAGATALLLGKSSKAATDAEEIDNKFRTVFSNIGNAAESTSTKLSKNFRTANSTMQEMLGNTGDLLVGFGFSEAGALKLSEQVVKVGTDLASFSNISGGTREATNRITKALLGETESMKGLGVVIRQGTKEYKNRLTLLMQNEKLTETQAKAQLNLKIIMEQSGKALGDYKRTADSAANINRELSESWKSVKESIGGVVNILASPALKGIASGARAYKDILAGDEGGGATTLDALLGKFLYQRKGQLGGTVMSGPSQSSQELALFRSGVERAGGGAQGIKNSSIDETTRKRNELLSSARIAEIYEKINKRTLSRLGGIDMGGAFGPETGLNKYDKLFKSITDSSTKTTITNRTQTLNNQSFASALAKGSIEAETALQRTGFDYNQMTAENTKESAKYLKDIRDDNRAATSSSTNLNLGF